MIKLSIIACACSLDRFNDLIDLVESIKVQTFKNYEAVIIIDGNKELYTKISEYLKQEDSKIKIILNIEHRGLSYGRNTGITNTSGELVAFVDDDAVLDANWADALVKTFNSNDVGAATGEIEPLWESPDMVWFPKELHWMISCSYTMTPLKNQEIERGFGTNMAFRREVIEKIGLFDTSLGFVNPKHWLGGEDSILFLKTWKLGKTVMFNPGMKIQHKVLRYRLKTKTIITRSLRGGISLAMLKKSDNYKPLKSMEKNYLKSLLEEFYPKKAIELLKKPKLVTLKQIIVVSMVIIFEGTGYLYGSISNKKTY